MCPVKEPYFFACEGGMPAFTGPEDDLLQSVVVTDFAAYRALFDEAGDARAIGEATPLYLYHEAAPPCIHHYLPDARIIIMLRNPVDRAYSHFWHRIRGSREPLRDFEQALNAEAERRSAGWEWFWRYADFGFYHAQVKRYLDTFGKAQVRIYLYEDFAADPAVLLRDIFGFIGVDPSFQADVRLQYNKTGRPRSRLLHYLFHPRSPVRAVIRTLFPLETKRRLATRLQQVNTYKPPLEDAVRNRLATRFQDDVLKLQALIGRDLSAWLPDTPP